MGASGLEASLQNTSSLNWSGAVLLKERRRRRGGGGEEREGEDGTFSNYVLPSVPPSSLPQSDTHSPEPVRSCEGNVRRAVPGYDSNLLQQHGNIEANHVCMQLLSATHTHTQTHAHSTHAMEARLHHSPPRSHARTSHRTAALFLPPF